MEVFNRINNEYYMTWQDAEVLLGKENAKQMRKNGDLLSVKLKKKINIPLLR